jgi:hypothetical protein
MDKPKRIIVIGAGPIGLEAALYARAAGHSVVVLESGELADHVSQWGFVRMFSPWNSNTTPLGRQAAGNDPALASNECPTAEEFVERYLLPISQSQSLEGCIDTGVRVLSVGHAEATIGPDGEPVAAHLTPFRLLVSERYGVEQVDHADVVLDCSGTYGNFRWAGRGGVPAVGEFGLKDRISYKLPDVLGRDRYRFAERLTLLIGTGTSAAAILMALATLAHESPRTRVIWAYQSLDNLRRLFNEVTLPSRRELISQVIELAESPPPWLELLPDAAVEQFNTMSGLSVILRCGTHAVSRRVDEIIAALGYRPDETVFEPLGVHPRYVDADRTRPAIHIDEASIPPTSFGPQTVVCPAPGYFILGAKSFGLNSNFVLRVGHVQIREVFQTIGEDPSLDLYAE